MQQVDGYKLVNFASHIEDATIEQAKQTASMPFVHPHVALMPDAHLGKGSAVGTVIPTVDAVIPAAVGVDIGCGMGAVLTSYTSFDIEGRDLRMLRLAIERAIPLSPGNYNARLDRFRTGLTEIDHIVGTASADLSNGRSISPDEIRNLHKVDDYLNERFSRHLSLLKNRAERP